MSRYPPAADPADKATLRLLYGHPLSIEVCFVKENGITVSAWVMQNTDVNRRRYNELFESENPPTTRSEALERAGATFYPRWYQCESLRLGEIETKATLLALRRLPPTQANLEAAEIELQKNTAGMHEDRLAEERKSLAWVREELEREKSQDEKAIANLRALAKERGE